MRAVLFDAPGPVARRRAQIGTAVAIVAGLAAAAWVGLTLAHAGMLDGQLWSALLNPDLFGLLSSGLLATAKVAGVSLLLSLLIGGVLAGGLMSRFAGLRAVLRWWVEVFRGLPLLLLIFFIFLGGPAIGVDIPTFWSLVMGLVLYNSAVLAEIFRAGIRSLPRGQAEAAAAIGLMPGETFWIILLPQAVRRMLPALISQLVVLIKETSLGFIIGYTEFLRDARTAVEFLGGEYSLPIYTMVAATYIAINCALSWLANRTDAAL